MYHGGSDKRVLRPKKVLKETWENSVSTITPGGVVKVTNTTSNEIWSDVVSVPEDARVSMKRTFLEFKPSSSNSYTSYSVEFIEYNYSKGTFWSNLFSFSSTVKSGLYPSGLQVVKEYKNWKDYPVSGNLNNYKNYFNK